METMELESLIVRLVGNSDAFVKMLNDAAARTKQFGQTVVSTFAAIGNAIGMGTATDAYSNYADNLVRIEEALKSNGVAVDATMASYKKFVDTLEETSRFSATTVTDLLAAASAFDLVGDKAEKAVRMAVNIAQAKRGVSPHEALQALSEFFRVSEMRAGMPSHGMAGQMGALFRLGSILGLPVRRMGMGMGERGGGDAMEQQKKLMDEITKQLTMFENVSSRLGVNFGGQMSRVKSILQDIGKDLGKIVAEWMEPFVKHAQAAARWFRDLDDGVKKMAVGLLGLAGFLTAAGPMGRFVMLALNLVRSISPITVALTAVAGATAVWIKYVGGLAAAWEMVRTKITEVVTTAIKWIGDFIDTHRRLTLAIGLVAGAVGVAALAWRTLTMTVSALNAILTITHIRQLAVVGTVTAWNAIVTTARVATAAFSMVLGAAGIVGRLTLLTGAIIAQNAVWFSYRTALLAWQAVAIGSRVILGAVAVGVFAVVFPLKALIAVLTAGIPVWKAFGAAVEFVFETALPAIGKGISAVVSAIPRLFRAVVSAFTAIPSVVRGAAFAFTFFVDSIRSVWDAFDVVKDAAIAFGRAVVTGVSAAFSALPKVLGVLLTGLRAAASGIAGVIGLISNAVTTVGSLIATISVTTLTTVLSVGVLAWVAYTGAVFAANLALSIFAGIAAAVTAAIATFTAGIGAVAALFASAFVTAFVAGKMAVTSFLDVLLAIPVKTGILAEVTNIFKEWGGILYDAYRAASLLPDVLKKVDMEAVGLKKDMSGMDVAWELLIAGFNLAVAQIKSIWPPLFEFIKTVANSAWTVLTAGWQSFVDSITPPFKMAFLHLAAFMKQVLGEALASFFSSLVQPLDKMSDLNPFKYVQRSINEWAGARYSAFTNMAETAGNFLNPEKVREQIKDVEGQIARYQRDVDAQRLYPGRLDQLQQRLTRLKGQLNSSMGGYEGMSKDQEKAAASVKALNDELQKQMEIVSKAAGNVKAADTDEVKNARKRVDEIRGMIGQAVKVQKEMEKQQQGIDLGKPFESATKEIKKWQSALLGSAEAYSHWFDYIDKLNEWEQKQGSLSPYRSAANREGPEKLREPKQIIEGGGQGEGAGAGGGGIGGEKSDAVVSVLRDIREILRQERRDLKKPRDVKINNIKVGLF